MSNGAFCLACRRYHNFQWFFASRRSHNASSYDKSLEGRLIADWHRGCRYTLKQKIYRYLFSWRRQGRPSPHGLSTLPYELRDVIFRELCGREIASIRLVCTEWEDASRPFFAAHYHHSIERSMFWITSSHLRRLEKLVRRFGPHMKTIYIDPARFTVSAWFHAFKIYLRHLSHARSSKQKGLFGMSSVSRSRSAPTSEIDHTAYFGRYHRSFPSAWQVYYNRDNIAPFFVAFAAGIVSQHILRVTGSDLRRIRNVMEKALPESCSIVILDLGFQAEKLQANVEAYGRSAPQWAFELGLFGEGGIWLEHGGYRSHVTEIVAKASAGRPLTGVMRASGAS